MFTERQIAVLAAACDRIIPADEFPNAWEAGVGDYILRLLSSEYANLVPAYRAGLADLDSSRFLSLAGEDQDDLLRRLEQAGDQFFAMLVRHCAEGYYADPGNSGNRDQISWKMIGFEVTG